MIFSTLNQTNCFICFLFFGLLTGILFNLFLIIFFVKYLKKYQKNIFFCIFFAFFIIFFAILINIFNFGKFSITLFLAYIISHFWSRKLTTNLVVFFSNKCYNVIKLIKPKKRNVNKNESKSKQS